MRQCTNIRFHNQYEQYMSQLQHDLNCKDRLDLQFSYKYLQLVCHFLLFQNQDGAAQNIDQQRYISHQLDIRRVLDIQIQQF